MYSKYRHCKWEEVEIGEVFVDDSHDIFIKIHRMEEGIWLNGLMAYRPRLKGRVIGNIENLGDKITELYKEYIRFYE